jgi:hypothetical protein
VKTFVAAAVSFIAGAAVSGACFSHRESDAAEFAASAFTVSTATYVLTFVDSLRHLRANEISEAINTLEPRLERDLAFLREATRESKKVDQAISAANAYRATISAPN